MLGTVLNLLKYINNRFQRNTTNLAFWVATWSLFLEDVNLCNPTNLIDNPLYALYWKWILFISFFALLFFTMSCIFGHGPPRMEAERNIEMIEISASLGLTGASATDLLHYYFPKFFIPNGLFALALSGVLVWNSTRPPPIYFIVHRGLYYRIRFIGWDDYFNFFQFVFPRTPEVVVSLVEDSPLALLDAAAEMEDEVRDGAGLEIEEVEETETNIARSEDLKHDIDHILENIESFTKLVSELLESGKTHLEALSNEFEEQIIMIHKDQMEKWQEEINELRLLDSSNEEVDALLQNARYEEELTEMNVVGSEELKQDIDRVLEKIESFTRMVSELREAGKTRIKELSNEFQEQIIMIHKEKIEEWQEEIKELRLLDSSNEEVNALLQKTRYLLQNVLIDS